MRPRWSAATGFRGGRTATLRCFVGIRPTDFRGFPAWGRRRQPNSSAASPSRPLARRVGVPVSIAPVDTPQGTRPARARDPQRLAALSENYGIAAPAERLVRALAGPAATPAPIA